ncbi:hypothetical protein ACS0TY_006241 [Phlomoides rotata]
MNQKDQNMIIILSLIFLRLQFTIGAQHPIYEQKNRRILHQPLFLPDDSAAAPPPPTPDLPADDQQLPFSNELPTGPTLDQSQQQQPPPLPAIGTAVTTTPVPTHSSTNPTKKLAIIASSTILTLGMLSAMAFYLYKNRVKDQDESQKLVRGNTQRISEESRIQPSTLHCIETAEPSTRGLVRGSPYRKLNAGRISDHYRPSPDLQPLPPLTKPPPPPFRINSPPPMSSSDDESHDAPFYTSQRTSPSSGHCNLSNNSTSVPHSKRTPPKSRFSASSSPDTRPVVIPPIRKSWPPSPSPPPTTSLGPLQPSKTLSYSPKTTKFSALPPSPHTVQHQSINNYEQKVCKTTIPPPPPPPPPLSITRKYGGAKIHTSLPVSKQLMRSWSRSPSPRGSPSSEKTRPVEEVNKGEGKDGSRPKMKHLHWDKVQATKNKATVWDQLKSPSFKLNEDAVETLFGYNSVSSVPREATRKFVLPSFKQEIRILDSKKSQNIAILLRAFNVTREEVSEALLDGNPEGLGQELFETLVKMAPSKEEEIKLKDFNDDISKLGTAERFLKAILDIPFAFRRVEAMLYRANFSPEVKYLRKSFQTLEEASEELKNSRLFLKLLEAVLRTGNRMNNGTNRGDAKAFKLDTLLKLVDIKGTDGKTTLLHFVVQEIIRSEGAGTNTTSENLPHRSNFKLNEEECYKQGLQVVAGLSKELGNVKKAAGMDSDVLSSYVSKLEQGLQKVRQVLQYENQIMQDNFFDSMKIFLEEAVDEISRVKAEERKALSLVKEVTQYFHGDDAKQEAHPLRMFMVIRDFLSILDNVCKDVGRMQDRTMGSGRSFRILTTAPLPVLSRFNVQNTSSDDDSM